ncbi:MAG: YceI family protein [Flavobacteriaceae bacterium]|jgi:polyisoprenoid-binding protein YceI|nr:YceI family protein [Flavobacteriaceae bacterium]
MKKFFLFVAFATLSLSAQKVTLDPAHARLAFMVTHMTISHVDGNFGKFNVNLDFTKPDFSDAKFTVSSDVTSLNTGIEMRDNHLKSADFFDAEKYPTLDFTTTSISKGRKGSYKLTGNLTLHGVAKPVTLNVKYNGSVVNPMSKKTVYGFTITGTIKRSDFGIGKDFPESIISDEVQLISNLEFIAQ